MAIPDYQSCMKPMLQILAKEGEMHLRQLNEALADHFGLTEEERAVLLPSGRQQVYRNRGGWAKTYLLKAGLIESTRRGYAQITDEGRAVLQRNPDPLNTRYLRDHFAAFRDFQQASRPDKNHETDASSTVDDQVESGEDEITPEERLEQSYQRLRSELAAELLDRIQASTPEFFEQLVVRLMVAMGYGGTLKDAGQAVVTGLRRPHHPQPPRASVGFTGGINGSTGMGDGFSRRRRRFPVVGLRDTARHRQRG